MTSQQWEEEASVILKEATEALKAGGRSTYSTSVQAAVQICLLRAILYELRKISERQP